MASEISRIQKEMYDPDELDFCENEAEKIKYLQSFDALLLPESNAVSYYKVISFHHSNLGTFTAELAQRLARLMEAASLEPSLVVTHLKTSIVRGNRRGHSIGNALRRFSGVFPEPDFENAFRTDSGDFAKLIDVFFRLLRSEPTAPEYIFFTDRHDRFAFFLCRYGNVHTVEFGKEILTPELLADGQWFEVTTRCYEKFSV